MGLIVDNWWKSAMSEQDDYYMSTRGDNNSSEDESSNSNTIILSGDNEMAQGLRQSIQGIASAFSTNRVPVAFRDSQIETLTRVRERQLPSLNEFRQMRGLPTYKKMEDINSSPLVTAKLRSLYSHPEEIELYPGVVAEQPAPKTASTEGAVGKGLWTGSTVAHAVLRDTVALIRDDPFYTDEWSPSNVTSWG